MTDKTVVIGIGAQKGGTSWLHYFLKRHPQCAMSAIKEAHYFDCIEMKRSEYMAGVVQKHRNKFVKETPEAASIAAPLSVVEMRARIESWADLLAHEQVDPAAYLEYLMLGSENAKVVGEVTPAYATLSPQSFEAMRSVAPKTKFIFIMRDPISRLWSNLRMRANNRVEGYDKILAHAEGDWAKVQKGGLKGVMRRSDYMKTLEALKSTIAPEAVHYEFYEDLFESGVARVCSFLDIDDVPAPVETSINEGAKIDLPFDLGRQMLDVLAPQYAYVRDMFGHLPAKWERSVEEYT